ncbi:MAG: arsenical resistance protein ArsH [Rhizobium sp.]|nr:arsenical resistance protein ArsH [Rhizobium sp.]
MTLPVTIYHNPECGTSRNTLDLNRRMKPSSYYDRVVDVCEELMKFTLLTRDASSYLTDRYSERKEDATKLEARVSLKPAV